jgi:hypothetical protein
LEDDEAKKPVIECPMSYTLLNSVGGVNASGECRGIIDAESLTVSPDFGDVLPVQLREILEVDSQDYKIVLPLVSKERLVLFNLGYCYEDFTRVLSDLRNEVIIHDMLMNEAVKKTDVDMEYIYSQAGNESLRGTGKLRLYETGLVVIPQKHQVIRIPYSDISSVSKEDLNIKIAQESGEEWLFSKLADEHDPLIKTLSESITELQQKTVIILRDILPETDSSSLRRLAVLMRDGKAARRIDIDAINPRVWYSLEKKMCQSGSGEAYAFLKDLAQQERISIGIKRGLVGDLTGEYIWFLMPIYGAGSKPGNAIAMEAANLDEETDGKATYFFRIVDRKDYAKKSIQEIDQAADAVMRTLNRCMLDINFRREPIYLQDEKLDEPAYIKYKIALQRIPSLKLLRDMYIGRVIHTSQEKWSNDVRDLLNFNVETLDSSIKWTGSS